MLSLLVTRDDITQAQEHLKATMETIFPDAHLPDAEFPYRHDDRYWYRAGYLAAEGDTITRHLNAFGTVENGLHPPATVEINIEAEGRNNQIGSFFARDVATGTVYLMHAGSINPGGYRFRKWLGGKQAEAFDGSEKPRAGFIVVPVNAATSGSTLIRYLEHIEAYRQGVTDDKPEAEGAGYRSFFEEPRGWRVAHCPGTVEYRSRHGEVVDALRGWRLNQPNQPMNRGWRIVKDEFIDMGVADGHDLLVELYEVKTSTGRSDVYSAIGQLMIHSPAQCRRTIVLPESPPLPNAVKAALGRLGIDLLQFRLDNERANII